MESSERQDAGPAPRPGGEDDFHLLVVATTDVPARALRDEVDRHVGDRPARVHVLAPAVTEGPLQHVMGDVDDARAKADERLSPSLDELRSSGAEVTGSVGDSDPVLAIEDALQTFPADEILIVTGGDDGSRWLEGDLFDRARRKFEPPMTHAVVDEAHGVDDVEQRGRGAESPDEAEADPDSRNLPPFATRDLLGLLVAIIGTLVLGVLAATCDSGGGNELEHGGGTSSECTAVLLIAVGVALINAAHIVGLFLFQSVRYRGGWAKMFATLSLALTPLGIIASLLILA
jgi:hypothetical protein